MKQKEKELLLKDLCGRLPYGVKCNVGDDKPYTLKRIEIDDKNGHLLDFIETKDGLNMQVYLSEVKPYLFPLSSMTEGQRKEYHNLCSIGTDECGDIIYFDTYESIDYLNKNKFDYNRYLIPMGLAHDATGLNIY